MSPSEPSPSAGTAQASASRRRAAGLGWLLVVAGLSATFLASALTGPTFDEDRRIAAVRRVTLMVRALHASGPSALFSGSAEALYDELRTFGTLPGLVSGWLGEALHGAHVLDALTASRLGWLLVTGIAPGALYALLAPSCGARVAGLSAVLLLGMPRWIHGAAVAREPSVVASLWLVLFALYFRARPPRASERRAGGARRFRLWSGLFAAALGVAISIDLASLWALPLLAAHSVLSGGRAAFRSIRRGQVPLPTTWLWFVLLTPISVFVTAPQLWRGGAVSASEWLFAPLAPSVEPLLYRGSVVTVADVPGSYAFAWLFATTPLAVLVLALAGFGASLWTSLRRGRTGGGVGLLAFLVVLAVLLGGFFAPRVLTRFPPRAEAAMPFLAFSAATALERLFGFLRRESFRSLAALGVALSGIAFACIDLRSASASFNLISGGTRGAVQRNKWTVGDGSEVAILAGGIDAQRRPSLTVSAPDVPRNYFTELAELGRIRTKVDTSRGRSDFTLARGERRGATYTVTHFGGVVWSLAKH